MSVNNASGTDIGTVNPFRYRGYYYDDETGYYYLQTRYYTPEFGRFISADSFASTDISGVLTTNMFAYCYNNSPNMIDPDGEAAMAIAGGGIAYSYMFGGSNIWNPLGWAVIGITTVVALGVIVYTIAEEIPSIKIATSKTEKNNDPDPYARPNQKKQGRERKGKARKSPEWVNNPNKKPQPPKKHTPGRGHRHHSVFRPIYEFFKNIFS